MTTTLYLTRHGQTEWNIQRRMQGSKDSPLTNKGIQQALALGKRLEHTKIDIVYSSSSQRALDTVKLIIGGRSLPVIDTDKLKEINLGAWEGLTVDEINAKYGDQYTTFWNTPHLLKDFSGETFDDFKFRVVSTIQNIIDENAGKNVLIVAHALVLKFALSYFDNTPLERIFDDRIIHQTSLSIVEVNDDRHQIIKYADTEHYDYKIS